MQETPVTLQDITTLSALASGIIPADVRDGGANEVHAGACIASRMRTSPYANVYVEGLKLAREVSWSKFGADVHSLSASQMHELLGTLREKSPEFFRQLRSDVCVFYLSDAGVWQRIGFPGPSSNDGGYPDFDQPQ
jgi:Gluconate 2-dehydrogenase subunit 3